ncbi:hypothetical protein J5X84_40490 [Streptosporangiaceae bacterium NEAU-GS5]|nr:hypothetical protein [Streptosporangiaceae bacterium NEAU-GS5]
MSTATTGTSPDLTIPGRAELPLWRLYALRFGYLILGGGLVVYKWPLLVTHEKPWPLMSSVVVCMLVAMSILALLGLRHPVRMLPILLFETAWKVIWLAVVALPLWRDDRMDAAALELTSEILWVVIILAVIPWRYVYSTYLAGRGDRWR